MINPLHITKLSQTKCIKSAKLVLLRLLTLSKFERVTLRSELGHNFGIHLQKKLNIVETDLNVKKYFLLLI